MASRENMLGISPSRMFDKIHRKADEMLKTNTQTKTVCNLAISNENILMKDISPT
jgi:hypothetical protein